MKNIYNIGEANLFKKNQAKGIENYYIFIKLIYISFQY